MAGRPSRRRAAEPLRRFSSVLAILAGALLAGCALKSDVRRVEDQVAAFRAESARADSAQAAQLAELIRFQQRVMDSLGTQIAATGQLVRGMQGSVAGDLYNIQQQLVQIQELTGQSQRRLNELRGQLETRGEQLNQAGSGDTTQAAAAPPGAGGPPPAPEEQMYQASLQQLRQGSVSTARLGFRELLRNYPSGSHAADALYFIGESYAGDTPDSAAAYYQQVVNSYPTSSRAPSALYKLGLLAEQRHDLPTARSVYQRVVQNYPRSDEAALARDKLKTLGP